VSRSRDETYWYGTGWKRLCGQTLKLVRPLVPYLADDMRRDDREPEEAAKAFIEELIQTVGALIDGVLDDQIEFSVESGGGLHVSSSLWSYVLPLFGDTSDLCRALASEADLTTGCTNRDVAPEQAVGRIVLTHMDVARRAASGESPNRLKTWEAIQRISSEIVRTNPGTALDDRCSDAHLRAVQALIAERYPNNKNYNMSLGALQAYFDRYCLDCAERFETSFADDFTSLCEETDIWPRFELCLGNLRKESEDGWEAALIKHKIADVELHKQDEYQARKGISRHEFDKRYAKALAFLRDCFSRTVQFQLMRGR
jgi:hypothetical protein